MDATLMGVAVGLLQISGSKNNQKLLEALKPLQELEARLKRQEADLFEREQELKTQRILLHRREQALREEEQLPEPPPSAEYLAEQQRRRSLPRI